MARNHKLFERWLWSYAPCTLEGWLVTFVFILIIGGVIGGSFLLSSGLNSSVPTYVGGALAAAIYLWLLRFAHRHN